MSKRIVEATSDSKGRTKSVRFAGNKTHTDVETAKRMAARGEIENAHLVRPRGKQSYIRTNPDRRKGNNLDELSGDK